MKFSKITIMTLTSLSLAGCFEFNQNTDQLCEGTPELRCELLNMNDGQCRLPRTDLIWHRYEVFKDPSDANVIQEYEYARLYRRCLELAAQIQPIDQSNLKQRRFNALMHSGEELERIVSQLQKSRSAETLYFLWSQIGDDQARREFLQMEGSPQLETADMQYALATFYTNRNHVKTVELLYKALELTPAGSVNTEILKTLASTQYRLDNREEAYIWAMVAKEYDIAIASDQEIQLLYGFTQDKYRRLNNIADSVEDAIDSGQFNKRTIPADLK
ncbi:DUF2989 domain-containing protein [Vibrio sp. ZSDE26]|uniref:DUF2989 domain-containing protein n=1 Tax=Vibrio amylolyticus TaxID=2847292 RepID=A0A9X1XJD4_9VIBR|nr:DUF2989 domain-containing protein [Vibrio amylolyticus]MCK6262045.1 DUF2989 domain-containing protein [Vibrio amylolyticus]